MIAITKFLPDGVQSNLIESGQLIQLMTILILVGVVFILGVARILASESLGTLLGGIAGYVLAQGIGRAELYQFVEDLKKATANRMVAGASADQAKTTGT